MIRFGRDSDLSQLRRRVIFIQNGKIAVRIVIHHGQTVYDNTLGESCHALVSSGCRRCSIHRRKRQSLFARQQCLSLDSSALLTEVRRPACLHCL
jgi:hypothetical protein